MDSSMWKETLRLSGSLDAIRYCDCFDNNKHIGGIFLVEELHFAY